MEEEEEERKFLGCLSLQVGVRTQAALNTIALILLLVLAIFNSDEISYLATLLNYSIVVFSPGVIT